MENQRLDTTEKPKDIHKSKTMTLFKKDDVKFEKDK